MNEILDEYYTIEDGTIFKYSIVESENKDIIESRKHLKDEDIIILDIENIPILEKMVNIINTTSSSRDLMLKIVKLTRRRLNLDKLLN